ncbi:5349_t:CDS:2, partial [Funneliformis geosporum]
KFEKQLEKCEALLKQKKNNIKNTVKVQVNEKRKNLKNKYNILKDHLEEDQHQTCSDNLKRQYKSHTSILEKAIVEKDKKI